MNELKLNFSVKIDGELPSPPYLRLDVPLTIQFGYASKTVADYKDELLNQLEIKQSQLFSLSSLLGNLLSQHGIARPDLIGEYIELLSEFGQGLSEISGLVREDFEKDNSDLLEIEKTNDNEQSQVLDLSEHQTNENECIDLAKSLSAVLNHPQTPQSLKITIANGIENLVSDNTDLVNFMDSPDYIAKVLSGG